MIIFLKPTGTKDDLAYAVMDAYRYRHAQGTKAAVQEKIKRKTEGGEDGTEEGKTTKKPKRLKEVYLVNKVKYHSEVTAEDLKRELRSDDLDEAAHRIIQYKIR